MSLSTDFTDQVPYSVDFVEFTNNAVVVVAEETRKLCWKRIEFLFRSTFSRLFTFSLGKVRRREGGGNTMVFLRTKVERQWEGASLKMWRESERTSAKTAGAVAPSDWCDFRKLIGSREMGLSFGDYTPSDLLSKD